MRRRRPSETARYAILQAQDYRCRYCGLEFSEPPHFDHIEPHSFRGNQSIKNFVAACRVCNQIKWAKCFDSLKSAVIHVREVRERRGLELAPVQGHRVKRQKCDHCQEDIKSWKRQKYCCLRCKRMASLRDGSRAKSLALKSAYADAVWPLWRPGTQANPSLK